MPCPASVASDVPFPTPLAFVDVETTGLSPAENRVTEIGVVTVDETRVERWTTLVRTPRGRVDREGSDNTATADVDGLPSFADIAAGLERRLSGRLFVAHNARFDHAFLRAEFERVGIAFDPPVVCSVMLSRKLYPNLPSHDLDSLAECHGLCIEARHRALPDADLVWQLWQAIHRGHAEGVIREVLDGLLAGPVLPPELDASLIGRLPGSPGAYVLHGEGNAPLFVGAASNLRLHVINYFRLDHASGKALEHAHRVTNITWRATRGMLGARLHAAALDSIHFAAAKRSAGTASFTWRLAPDAVPSVSIVPMSETAPTTDRFGLFASERKARNALERLARRHRLCHCLLGISDSAGIECAACPIDRPDACVGSTHRHKELVRVFTALRPHRVPAWPHRGPVGIREHSDMHVVDRWQFLGTAQSDGELHQLLESRPPGFDKRLHRLLDRTLSRLPQDKVIDLSHYAGGKDLAAQWATDFGGAPGNETSHAATAPASGDATNRERKSLARNSMDR